MNNAIMIFTGVGSSTNMERRLGRYMAPLFGFLVAVACAGSQKVNGDKDSSGSESSSSDTNDSDSADTDTTEHTPFEPDATAKSGKWSDPETWPDGKIPAKGDDVEIPAKAHVVLDMSPEELGTIWIDGSLTFDRKDLELTAKNIMVHGRLTVGTEDEPFTHNATITLNATDVNESIMGMGTRGITVMGGRLDLHGVSPEPVWTRIDAHAAAGDTKLQLEEGSNWNKGDRVILAPTDYFYVGRTEEFVLDDADDDALTLASPIQKDRWGVLQYVTDAGMSLEPASEGTNKVLDERAEVANLTRNVVIQGADDAIWEQEAFGAHIMIMEGSQAYIDGIEVRRAGQAGRLARYPIHFHRMSYDEDGNETEDLTGQYVTNSSIWDSKQRCIVLHASNGVLVQNNVCYKIRGHAIFMEDAVERRNEIRGNIVLHTLAIEDRHLLLKHEGPGGNTGPSGYWITNPDNPIRDNVAADCEGNGFWFAFPEKSIGSSTAVDLHPVHMFPDTFSGSFAHSNKSNGIFYDGAPIDEEGNVGPIRFMPRANGLPDGEYQPFRAENFTSYKHIQTSSGGAFWNNSLLGTYSGFMIADFTGLGVKGASDKCLITDMVVIGISLNNANPPSNPDFPTAGAASYHSQCDLVGNIFVNLPYTPDRDVSGAFSTVDYYIRPVDRGLVRNVDNVFINTHPGSRFMSPNLNGTDNYAIAGALWDPHGLWGPKENYWVFDVPFLTGNTECSPVEPAGNGMSCKGPYYGINLPRFNGTENANLPLEFVRQDLGEAVTWSIGDGQEATKLGTMRHGTAGFNSIISVRSPGLEAHQVRVQIDNLYRKEDSFIMGLMYTDSQAPELVAVSNWPGGGFDHLSSYAAWKSGNADWASADEGNFWTPLDPVNSMDELKTSDGTKFWFDEANDLVWIRCVGNVVDLYDDGTDDPFTDAHLYRPTYYSVYASRP